MRISPYYSALLWKYLGLENTMFSEKLFLGLLSGPGSQQWAGTKSRLRLLSRYEIQAQQPLRWVDRDRALCMHRCLPSPWQLSDLERMLHANCTDQITWPRLHRVTRGAHTLGASMLCLWRCGSRGCISLATIRKHDFCVIFTELFWFFMTQTRYIYNSH